MHRLLKAALPAMRGILAYCDPVERRDKNGQVVKRGHVGTIYKATNATYRGVSSPRTFWLSPGGASLTDRLLSEVRLSETGERNALAKLAALGAPQRHAHESGGDYVARLRSSARLRPTRHPGNLAFTWQL